MSPEEPSDPGRRRKVALALGLLGVALTSFLLTSAGGSSTPASEDAKAFYTVDDGATYFADKATLVPPFQHDGKPAVRAIVFTADGGKTRTVGYLERYAADAKKRIDASPKAARPPTGVEVKKPGPAGAWVPANTAGGMAIIGGAAPKGQDVEAVTP